MIVLRADFQYNNWILNNNDEKKILKQQVFKRVN